MTIFIFISIANFISLSIHHDHSGLVPLIIMMIVMTTMNFIIMIMMTACRHIPTMTKSHHGGEMSVMIKVGMCQCQIPTIHDKLQRLALVSCSTRPQC